MAENSLERMLAVIDLFREESLEWTPEEMMQELSYSRSTLYRYLKTLVEAGFLSSMPNTGYTLGPRIIELDYLLRRSDPLILAGRPFLLELVARYPGTAMLVRLFKNKIVCVHHEKSSKDMRSSYTRGRPMPITRGATAKAILAFLPRTHLMKLIERNLEGFRGAGFGDNSPTIKQKLKMIRQQGYAVAHGEVTPAVYGFAAPIFDIGQTVIASLSVTIEDRYVDLGQIGDIADHIKFCASVLSTTLAERSRKKDEAKT
jgi:DNA-binding IclR family transcriptional regulator